MSSLDRVSGLEGETGRAVALGDADSLIERNQSGLIDYVSRLGNLDGVLQFVSEQR